MPDKIWEWAPRARRYRDPVTGRFVSRDEIRRGVDRLIADSQKVITTASDELRIGRMELADWQEIMRKEIKRTQLGAQALLRGGWNQLTDDDMAQITSRVRAQFEYLHDFTAQLRDGRQRTDGTFMNRARMYPASARIGYHEDESELMRAVGYRLEHNILHPAEHCGECLDCWARGWVPIGSNPPIGARRCFGNDRCTMRYR